MSAWLELGFDSRSRKGSVVHLCFQRDGLTRSKRLRHCNDGAEYGMTHFRLCSLTVEAAFLFSPSTWNGLTHLRISVAIFSNAKAMNLLCLMSFCRPPRHARFCTMCPDADSCRHAKFRGPLRPPRLPRDLGSGCISHSCRISIFIIAVSSRPDFSRMVVRTKCHLAYSIIPVKTAIDSSSSSTKHEVSGFTKVLHVNVGCAKTLPDSQQHLKRVVQFPPLNLTITQGRARRRDKREDTLKPLWFLRLVDVKS